MTRVFLFLSEVMWCGYEWWTES